MHFLRVEYVVVVNLITHNSIIELDFQGYLSLALTDIAYTKTFLKKSGSFLIILYLT